MDHDGNIILIGMAGVGKSTIGVLLARALRRDFIDADIRIQQAEGRKLQDIIDTEGGESFLAIEAKHVCAIRAENAVISTGGSVVHSPAAMEHLKSLGTVVLLEAPLEVLKTRVHNTVTRGLVMMGAKNFEELYALRRDLYRRYADTIIACDALGHDAVVDAVLAAIEETR